MNYERTVNDFGKCNGHGKNQYGFPFISHCVGMSGTKCMDSRFPVACGDRTCRRSYPECLQVIQNIEKHQETLRERARQDPTRVERPIFRSDVDNAWVFDRVCIGIEHSAVFVVAIMFSLSFLFLLLLFIFIYYCRTVRCI